jgi:hypothetical protein
MPNDYMADSLATFRYYFKAGCVSLALLLFSTGVWADGLTLQAANLHNPYFLAPPTASPPPTTSNYVPAPAPRRWYGLDGDVVYIPFTIVVPVNQRVNIKAQLTGAGKVFGSLDASSELPMRLYRALDVHVEGNSNASCSCPAGQLPQSGSPETRTCVSISAVDERLTPKGCPVANERRKIAETWIRSAPFIIKDPLEIVSDSAQWLDLTRNSAELFVIKVPITAELPKATLDLRISVKAQNDSLVSISLPVQVLRTKLDRFPLLDLSYWISEDPRDLVSPPIDAPINSRWGGEWWSEEHWQNLRKAAHLQSLLGVTNTLIPLFVRNPFGLEAKPLVRVKCITGSNQVPKDFSAPSGGTPSAFNQEVAKWKYEFDFTNLHRWIEMFKGAGFRRFEGSHLFANGGKLPAILECDLYHNKTDDAPYAQAIRFMPRSGSSTEDSVQKSYRVALYRDVFLPTFLMALSTELRRAGIENNYLQHLIDENAPDEESISAYLEATRLVRTYLPRIQTIDAINQYTAARYKGTIDLPVMHLLLLYDDQGRRSGIRREIEQAFPGRKYFYNTALRMGGPNQFLDTSPLDSRIYPWLALETGYNGILYWASNRYRYPAAKDLSLVKRTLGWSPYNNSLGPMPDGGVIPGYGAGANWNLYPTASGLIASLRALRLRDGLVDHWLYIQSWNKCNRDGAAGCREMLINIRKRISGNSNVIADFSRNPSDYDEARELMVGVLEN